MMDEETAGEGDSNGLTRIEHHKTIIVGEKGVGKSSILARYMFHAHEISKDLIVKRQCSSAAYVYRRSVRT